MYAVPVKVNLPAKKLIENFEKGEVTRSEDEEEAMEEKPSHPEMNSRELAQPGTARKRMMQLEAERLKREAEAKDKPNVSTRKLSEDKYGDFAHDRIKEGGRASGVPKNEVEHPREEHPKIEHHKIEHPRIEHPRMEHPMTEHPRVEHHAVGQHPVVEDSVEGDYEVFIHNRDEPDRGGPTKVLVVTSTGSGPESHLDKGLVDSVVGTFKDGDHEVHVTDLNHTKGHAIDYSLERSRVKSAQLVVLHFRPILHTVPAALMDWLQNVLVDQFAFDRRHGKTFDDGLLKGKRCLLLVTLSEDKTHFDGDNLLGDFSQYLWPIQNGVIRYAGFSVLTPQLIFGLHDGSHGDFIEEAAQALTDRLRNVWHEKPLFNGDK